MMYGNIDELILQNTRMPHHPPTPKPPKFKWDMHT